MRVVINGEHRQLSEGATLADAAAVLGVDPDARGIAMALDGEVVPKGEVGSRALEEGSRVEVVMAIQGGSR